MNHISFSPSFSLTRFIYISMLTFCFLLTGCGDSSPEKREFMQGCKYSGGSGKVCECAWDKMTEQYSPAQLKSIGEGRALPPANFQQQMTDSFQQCILK
ncbi:hypothetical protein [Budvicia aquatica]|uniref:Uncharacterized protein n=1 Tax=Budvicia aquatica TaxID=82979 RepID=A0A2C6C5Y6_9GAMM|nr:hypothetical protein [Budvicia aquatica]PHI31267.1 hypothetical protein CRN84_18940 [Budvicia aquatica]PHI31760.1 hypothetical protein CRN84_21735 [Budvicia aquatica]VFS51554.1 Uncharacterised protein [Budvicia aquatica]VFS52665.1 Uncharacterised protein [Budvicia aquatica]